MDFFEAGKIADRVEYALEEADRMQALRDAARATAVEQFDLRRTLLPRWLAVFDNLVNGRRPT